MIHHIHIPRLFPAQSNQRVLQCSRLLRGTGSTHSGARPAERPQETAPSRAQIKAQITRCLRCFPGTSSSHQTWWISSYGFMKILLVMLEIYLLGFIIPENC